MHWFGGSIAEAVTLSKQKNAIFVVFVEGDNDLSTEMAATIDDTAVVSRLSDETNFLAVKLKSGTTYYTHFAQIYQFVPVPSLFFIGRNGTPLEVVCAGVHANNLATRIDRILQEHHTEKPLASQPSTSSSSHSVHEATTGLIQAEGQAAVASAPTVNTSPATDKPVAVQPSTSSSTHLMREAAAGLIQAENQTFVVTVPNSAITTLPAEGPSPPKFPKPDPVPESDRSADKSPDALAEKTTEKSNAEQSFIPEVPLAPAAEYSIVCDGDVCVRRPRAPDQPSTSRAGPIPTLKPLEPTSSEVSVEEKLDRAKELIEAKRREKAEQEKELERQRELERRNTGQGVAELKRWQAEQEMKQIQEERKREKLENDLARQRILEQIAQDRAERRARDAPPAAPTSPAAAAPAEPSSHLAGEPPGTATAGDGSRASARVQFKLPDGTSHTAHFDALGTLGQVQEYVANNLQLSASNFALWTAFPRRELSDPAATLRELGLAPSAALLVLPRRAAEPRGGPTQYFSVYAFVSTLLATYLYNPSLAIFSWLRERLFPPPAVGPRTPGVTVIPPAGGPIAPPRGTIPRRRTNIHRLPGDAANDDDNNTWNGNSTQQM